MAPVIMPKAIIAPNPLYRVNSKMAAINSAAANTSVRQQIQHWNQNKSQKQVLTSAKPVATPVAGASAQPEGRLVLGTAAGSGQQGSGLSGNGEALRNVIVM